MKKKKENMKKYLIFLLRNEPLFFPQMKCYCLTLGP